VARSAWSAMFPLPLVAIVVLLGVLILLTPNLLLGTGPAAGSLATQAQLTVDVPPGGNVTHFYVNGLGEVRYSQIDLTLSTQVSWPAPPSVANITWGKTTAELGVLATSITTKQNPVALNVTATFVDAAGATVVFWGLYEFFLTATTLECVPLAVGQSTLPSTPLASLPVELLLASASPGAVP
jgi:hypothetical protein